MSSVEKIALAVVSLATITTLILPRRQTAEVIDASASFVRATLGTAMGTN